MRDARLSTFLAVVAAVGLSTSVAPLAKRASGSVPVPLERLSQWSQLTQQHAPGERDDAADAASLLSNADLDAVREELEEARRLLRLALEAGAGLDEPVRWNRQTITVRDLAVALRVSVPELETAIARGDRAFALALTDRYILRLLERGALLHADVALVVPAHLRLVQDVGPDAKASLLVQDGRLAGLERTADSHVSTHFHFGSALTDLARDVAGPSDRTALWYRATAAYLLQQEAFGDAMPYLLHAAAVLPDDAMIRFYTGALHEVFALPRAQAVVQSVELPAGMEHDVGTAEEELRIAERHYRRALDLEPDLTLAAVHHARVVGLLGDLEASRTELLRVRPSITDRETQYFAELFLGDAARDLGQIETARTHYGRAAALYPRAQTPGLAESSLLRAGGDRENAIALMRKVLSRRVGRSLTDDPWWTYYRAHVADADRLVAAMRDALATGGAS